jgi:hypothetical protein
MSLNLINYSHSVVNAIDMTRTNNHELTITNEKSDFHLPFCFDVSSSYICSTEHKLQELNLIDKRWRTRETRHFTPACISSNTLKCSENHQARSIHTHLRRLVVRHWEKWRWRSASGCWSNCKRGPAPAATSESEEEVGCRTANKDRMRRMDGALEWSRNLGEEQELGMNSKAAILPIQFNSIQFNFNPRHLTCLLSFLPFSPISPHSSPTSPSTVLLLLLLRALHACISSQSPHKPQSTPTIQQWSHKCGM